MTLASSVHNVNGSPPRSGLKRKFSSLTLSGKDSKLRRLTNGAVVKVNHMRRPTRPAAEPWPLHELRAFDAPTEGQIDINYGPMLKEVLRSRGWRYKTNVCHGTFNKDTEVSTFYVKEFEASLCGEDPKKVFGKKGAVMQDGYRLQTIPLPKYALWMMGRLPYRIPGKDAERVRDREDFIKLVIKHGDKLPGKPGNYRIAKFPGTEALLFKTKFTEAFKDKTWYPKTYELPRDKASFLKEIRQRGESRNNMWIGKPENDYGGTGIRVWKGTDRDLAKTVRESENAKKSSIIQHYIADPLLIGGYKFHMRIHLVITNVNPLQAYVQENGQCLFATKPYTLSSKTLGEHFDPPAHVTNMGLNAKPENKDNYFKRKPFIGRGQQIRMRQLMNYLEDNHPKFRKNKLWQQILNISAETAKYIGEGIHQRTKTVRDRHFEIFGMDLMLDKDLKVYMCEVNTDPGLGYPDEEVLGSPNPDYQKELRACEDTFHDLFALLGLDAGQYSWREQKNGSLRHWFELDFSDVNPPQGS
jgi:hypothetical protein